MEIDKNKLLYGTMGAFLITIGIMLSEQSIESSNKLYKIFGMIFFILGWSMFIYTQKFLFGIVVPIIAIIGQLYFGYMINQKEKTRKKYFPISILFWMIFMGVWIYYGYQMSLSKNNFNKDKSIVIFSGILSLIVGMMGYFFLRKEDWNYLSGGLIPKLKTEMKTLNPFVPMVGFGWALISIGNSII